MPVLRGRRELFEDTVLSFEPSWEDVKLSHGPARPGSNPGPAQRHLVLYTSCSVGCVRGFWWFPPFELHVYSSMWSEAEALSEYGAE
jgi:hypothetical protein